MGLVARAIEARGIATVSLSIVREVTEKTPPPRALYLRFPFGHALGEPGNANQQLAILQLAFRLLLRRTAPEPSGIPVSTGGGGPTPHPTGRRFGN